MNKLISYSFILLLAGGIFTSCVPKRKLLASQQWVQQLQSDSASCHNTLNDCNATVKKLQEQKSSLQDANAAAANDLANLSSKSKLTIAEQAKRLQSLQDLIQAQRDVMTKLKKSITDALINFKADELSVYIKDGKVYVSLSEKLLFKSGSAVVDPKGKEALGSLAKVLNSTSDISVMIEGHTDTIPIKNAKFEDNCSLSVSRATSIVRILSTDYGFDAHRIIASGRSEFYPVMANTSPEGRAVNRRTEIILSPDLNELFRLLDQ